MGGLNDHFRAMWNEALHPRGHDGKFANGGSGGAGGVTGKETRQILKGAPSEHDRGLDPRYAGRAESSPVMGKEVPPSSPFPNRERATAEPDAMAKSRAQHTMHNVEAVHNAHDVTVRLPGTTQKIVSAGASKEEYKKALNQQLDVMSPRAGEKVGGMTVPGKGSWIYKAGSAAMLASTLAGATHGMPGYETQKLGNPDMAHATPDISLLQTSAAAHSSSPFAASVQRAISEGSPFRTAGSEGKSAEKEGAGAKEERPSYENPDFTTGRSFATERKKQGTKMGEEPAEPNVPAYSIASSEAGHVGNPNQLVL